MTKEQSGRMVFLVEARQITYDVGEQSGQARRFFSELLGDLDPALSEKESKPMFLPYGSGNPEERVLTHLWLRGLDRILLSVWPFGSLAILEVTWSRPFSPAFCLGMIEDYFKTQSLVAHSLVLQADVQVSLPPPAVVPVGEAVT